MNVLALYDIHGNIDALEAVLADPRAANPTSSWSAATSFPGPFARATLDRLAALDARWIRGNGEREVAEAIDGPEPDPDDPARVTAKLTLDEIGAEAARPLGDLPLTLELDGVLYCHATPRARRRDGHADLPARALRGGAGGRRRARSVVAGHTHQQHDVAVGARPLPQRRQRRHALRGRRRRPLAVGRRRRARAARDRRTTRSPPAGGCSAPWPDARSLNASLVEPVDAIEITRFFESLI